MGGKMEVQKLEIKNLTKDFQMKSEKIIALKDVSYTFYPNKLYVIMGHSGSGKSTLLNILGTLNKQTSGNYFINNQDVSTFKEEDLCQLRMSCFGFIFQDYCLDPNLKSFENVILPMYINKEIKKEEYEKRALQLLEYVNLNNRNEHYPKELSGGEQQRVAIARSLANNPSVILADEPTGNLDESNEEIIFKILRKLADEGKCVIVVSHNQSILKYADTVLYMKDGQLGDNHE